MMSKGTIKAVTIVMVTLVAVSTLGTQLEPLLRHR
jgi:hypothetical protein